MKKNILYICTEKASGMVSFASSLVNSASKLADCNIFLLYVIDREDAYQAHINSNIPTFTYTIPQTGFARLKYKVYPQKLVTYILDICKANSIEYVHLLTLDYVLGSLINKISGHAKIVYTVHDLYAHTSFSNSIKEKLVKRFIYMRSVKNRICADILVTSSLEQFDDLKKMYQGKMVCFHHFPSLLSEDIIHGNEIVPELSDVPNYILFFGHIDTYKGVELLYKTYMDLGLYKRIYLVIAGRGPIYFERVPEQESHVIFLNRFIKNEELKFLFEHAICVVYPYLTITQSGVLSFAYYFQVPVIVSNVRYFLDSIIQEKTALAFETGNSLDLKQKLSMILNPSFNTADMKNNQASFYELCFSESALLSELKNVYSLNS